jgi:hypothetical protein
MEPEVVMNLWVFIQSIGPLNIIYELGVRPYMMTGTDDEKMALLKDLATNDFHFAHRYPLPADRYYLKITEKDGRIVSASSGDFMEEGPNIRKGVALVRPDISGGRQIEYFTKALDVIVKSLPTRCLGMNGPQTEMPKVNLGNLLTVITNVNVDDRGNQVPHVDDARRSSPRSAVANLWMFHDERARAIYALAGRGYMVHGSDSEKARILKSLAPYDFPMARALPVTSAVSTDHKYSKTLFGDILDAIEHEIPTRIGLDGKMQNTVKISPSQLMLNATRITERSSNLGDAISIQLVDTPLAKTSMASATDTPTPAKKSLLQRLFRK